MRRLVKLFLWMAPAGLQGTALHNCEEMINAMTARRCADLAAERDKLLIDLTIMERDYALAMGELHRDTGQCAVRCSLCTYGHSTDEARAGEPAHRP